MAVWSDLVLEDEADIAVVYVRVIVVHHLNHLIPYTSQYNLPVSYKATNLCLCGQSEPLPLLNLFVPVCSRCRRTIWLWGKQQREQPQRATTANEHIETEKQEVNIVQLYFITVKHIRVLNERCLCWCSTFFKTHLLHILNQNCNLVHHFGRNYIFWLLI